MATIELNAALRGISQKKFERFYLLLGEERYFSERVLRQLRHDVVDDGLREFNETLFYASEIEVADLMDSLQTLPVMASHRLVILKEGHLLSEKDWSLIETMDFATMQSTVFVVMASSLDKRKKSIKKIIERASVIECQTPPDSARAGWIRMMAREKRLELDNDALGFLVQMGGNSLEELERSLEQLVLFYGEGQRLAGAQLANVLERHREESIFSLAEAVGKKDRTQALYSFYRLHSQGENEVAQVALLARHFRLLLKIKSGQRVGLKGPALAQKVGVNNYFLPQYVDQSARWNEEGLSRALLELADMDRLLKSSPLSGEFWIEKFLLTQGRSSIVK